MPECVLKEQGATLLATLRNAIGRCQVLARIDALCKDRLSALIRAVIVEIHHERVHTALLVVQHKGTITMQC